MVSCHGAGLPLFRLKPPPPWQPQDEELQLMYLPRNEHSSNGYTKNDLLGAGSTYGFGAFRFAFQSSIIFCHFRMVSS